MLRRRMIDQLYLRISVSCKLKKDMLNVISVINIITLRELSLLCIIC